MGSHSPASESLQCDFVALTAAPHEPNHCNRTEDLAHRAQEASGGSFRCPMHGEIIAGADDLALRLRSAERAMRNLD
jgi:hypothetical protein